jgi:hypothetical protein
MHCRRYRETPDNNLKHWGLDYPPLSAYQVGGLVHAQQAAPHPGQLASSSTPLPTPARISAHISKPHSSNANLHAL